MDKIVRFSHVSVRRGSGGRIELNVGLRSEIEIKPDDLRFGDYPPLTRFIHKIDEITGNERMVDAVGLIKQIYSITTFKRQNGSDGKVRHIELGVHNSRIMLVL